MDGLSLLLGFPMDALPGSPQDNRSYIILQFLDNGSAQFSFGENNVSPMQILLAAEWLNFQAKYRLNMMENERMAKLQVEEPLIQVAKLGGKPN